MLPDCYWLLALYELGDLSEGQMALSGFSQLPGARVSIFPVWVVGKYAMWDDSLNFQNLFLWKRGGMVALSGMLHI